PAVIVRDAVLRRWLILQRATHLRPHSPPPVRNLVHKAVVRQALPLGILRRRALFRKCRPACRLIEPRRQRQPLDPAPLRIRPQRLQKPPRQILPALWRQPHRRRLHLAPVLPLRVNDVGAEPQAEAVIPAVLLAGGGENRV